MAMVLKMRDAQEGSVEQVEVRTVWQDRVSGMDVLYYEHVDDLPSKGTFVPLSGLVSWQVMLEEPPVVDWDAYAERIYAECGIER